ncbi:hypothetical protein BDZ97DRAFT_1907457 [Flammula alnicola]|nr:hypothetical protein BDZ97DRAFT_1907457 [Flammula alnicola]
MGSVSLEEQNLFTEKKTLYEPAWGKCKHATRRGAIAFLTFSIQKKIIELFLVNAPRIIGLSHDIMFGYKNPIQRNYILVPNPPLLPQQNIRIARDRAWDQTVASRGKGPDFWQPYVEERKNPSKMEVESARRKFVDKWLRGWFGLSLSNEVAYPFAGMAVSAWFKALETSHFL